MLAFLRTNTSQQHQFYPGVGVGPLEKLTNNTTGEALAPLDVVYLVGQQQTNSSYEYSESCMAACPGLSCKPEENCPPSRQKAERGPGEVSP